MHYKFPTINHINDILPHIEGRKEFVVANKGDYTVINYLVNLPDSFDIDPHNPVTGIMRRECRGIKFYRDGKIAARPFHKFHNLGEREETQPYVLDFSQPHVIMEKMDGSMISPLFINGELNLTTKMGITDIAKDAEKLLTPIKSDWLRYMISVNKTPIFEYISPNNKIVVNYPISDLVLLAVRDNITGEYIDETTVESPFTTVTRYGTLDGNIGDYINKVKHDTFREGDIIRFETGHMIKIKNEWYVSIHNAKEKIQYDRNIIKMVLDNTLDDVYSDLDSVDKTRIDNLQKDFWNYFNRKENKLIEVSNEIIQKTNGDRKKIAVDFVSKMEDKAMAQYVFGSLDNRGIRDMLMLQTQKNLGSNTNWDNFWEWLQK